MYYCDLCEKTFFNKTDFTRHLNRVKKCGIETDTNNIKLMLEKYKINENYTKNSENYTKNSENYTKNSETYTKNSENYTKNNQCNNKLECEYCHKIFCRQNVKKKHIIISCKKKKELDLIEFKKDEIEKSQIINSNNTTTNITNNTNITINNNITQNIKINGFGSEDISYVTNDFLQKVLKNPYLGFPKLVELIHFNPDHPENNNVKIINKREPYLDYFTGDSWKTADKSKVIGDMLLTKKSITDDLYNDIDDEFKDYEKYSNAIEYFVQNFIFEQPIKANKKSLKNIYNHLEKDIYTLILNHRKFINDYNLI